MGVSATARGAVLATHSFEYKNVYFSYPKQAHWALEDFNLAVKEGESVALVGRSGIGKSTALYLLCGFSTPQRGELLIGGRSVSEIGLPQLRGLVSLVSQQTHLFNLTVAQNISLGNPKASEAEIWLAAQRANADSFISRLPQGLHTPLGSLGNTLSGGQIQRLAIARAFLKAAPILLLDEPTSALDAESRVAVVDGLKELMRGRTVLLVTHTPELLPYFDRTIEIRTAEQVPLDSKVV